jgi:hypothetical protein
MSAVVKSEVHGENRRTRRRTIVADARIIDKRGGWSLINCTVRDISDGGAKLQFDPSLEIPTHFDLLLVNEMQIIPVRIRWRRRDFMGVQFTAAVRKAPAFRLC